MARLRGRGCRRDGFVTVQAVFVYAVALMTLVWLANFIVFQYGRGAVRAAIDEGARTGSRVGASEASCEARAHEVLDNLLGGVLGKGVKITCRLDGSTMLAEARGTFTSWAPPVPTYRFDVTATALQTQEPK